jgi:hypothetical protein
VSRVVAAASLSFDSRDPEAFEAHSAGQNQLESQSSLWRLDHSNLDISSLPTAPTSLLPKIHQAQQQLELDQQLPTAERSTTSTMSGGWNTIESDAVCEP